MSWKDGLTGGALRLAQSDSRTIRVIAGPGTGKTYALLRRLARLLEEGVEPERLLLVTFTRVAAADLERGLKELGCTGADRVAKGTLHALCLKILCGAGIPDQLARVPRTLMDFEVRFLLEDLGLYGRCGHVSQRKAMLKAFEAGWARCQDQTPGWPTSEEESDFQGQLMEWLRFHRCMLVGEIVPLTLGYLRANPNAAILHQYDHVLVDEYQDLNPAEQHVIDLLATHGSLCVAGDQDQAIYEEFRYAQPEGLANFHLTHDATEDVALDESKRCPAEIVRIANALIRYNTRRSSRQLVACLNEEAANVVSVQWETLESETRGIAGYIATGVRNGEINPGQTLVLSPSRQIGQMVRDQLTELGVIAYSFFHEEELEGDPKKLDESSAQQAFTLLTLLADPEDRVALRAWLGFGSRDLGAKSYLRLRQTSSTSATTPKALLGGATGGRATSAWSEVLKARYVGLNKRLAELDSLTTQEMLDSLFPAGEAWADKFRSALGQAGEVASARDAVGLLRERITQPDLPSRADFVRVMSLHKSKGLSAKHVFVLSCVEGLLPRRKTDPCNENERRFEEEQRRLFYVAITRAKQTLVLSSIRELPAGLAHKMGVRPARVRHKRANVNASSFLTELGPECATGISGQDWLQLLS